MKTTVYSDQCMTLGYAGQILCSKEKLPYSGLQRPMTSGFA